MDYTVGENGECEGDYVVQGGSKEVHMGQTPQCEWMGRGWT